MITDYQYDLHTLLTKKCFRCKYLTIIQDSKVYGNCTCKTNKIKNKFRCVTDNRCAYKEITEKGGAE